MDDIRDKILCDIGLFADDTCLLEIVHTAIESARRLNSDLKSYIKKTKVTASSGAGTGLLNSPGS